MKRKAVKADANTVMAEITKRINSHPDPARACAVIMGIMEMIDDNWDLNQIKTVYGADLKYMRQGR